MDLYFEPRIVTLNQPGSDSERCNKRFYVLKDYVKEGSIGAEIDVFKGSFLDYMLALKPGKLYAVDPWYRLHPDWFWAVDDKSTVTALIRILQAFRPEIESRKLEVCVEFATEFLDRQSDFSLDWIYIDTSHTYKQTMAEVLVARNKAKRDGFIMGDDYYEDKTHVHHGVCKALRELEADKHIEIIEIREKQWIARSLFLTA